MFFRFEKKYYNTSNISESANANSRSEAFTVDFQTPDEYCKDEDEKKKAQDALLTYFKSSGVALCIDANYCTLMDFVCVWNDGKLTIQFSLQQEYRLSDSTIMADTADSIKASTITLNLEANKRRKRETSFVSQTIISETSTTCKTGYILDGGACIICPFGYGQSNGVCAPCPIGYYSDEVSVSACKMCPGNFKTLTRGSTEAGSCKDPASLCSVPGAIENTGLTPPTGALTVAGETVSVSCAPGYALEENISVYFACSENPISPICYSKWDSEL